MVGYSPAWSHELDRLDTAVADVLFYFYSGRWWRLWKSIKHMGEAYKRFHVSWMQQSKIRVRHE